MFSEYNTLTETVIISFINYIFTYIYFFYFRSYTVLLGAHNVNSNSEIQRISVEQAFPHKHFNATSLVNDVMLLKVRISSHRKFIFIYY